NRQRSGAIDLEDGEVGLHVAADEPRGKLASVRKPHDDRLGILHDVVVGENVSGRIHDHARASRPRLVTAATETIDELVAEEFAKPLELCGRGILARNGADVHDSRCHAVGDAGERIFQGAQNSLRTGVRRFDTRSPRGNDHEEHGNEHQESLHSVPADSNGHGRYSARDLTVSSTMWRVAAVTGAWPPRRRPPTHTISRPD